MSKFFVFALFALIAACAAAPTEEVVTPINPVVETETGTIETQDAEKPAILYARNRSPIGAHDYPVGSNPVVDAETGTIETHGAEKRAILYRTALGSHYYPLGSYPVAGRYRVASHVSTFPYLSYPTVPLTTGYYGNYII